MSRQTVRQCGTTSVLAAAVFIPFLRSLEPRLAMLMILSGTIFVCGAIGMEFVAAWLQFSDQAVRGALARNMVALVEESLEMYGIALFNTVLFYELAGRNFEFRQRFRL